jgi:hypothetical protein
MSHARARRMETTYSRAGPSISLFEFCPSVSVPGQGAKNLCPFQTTDTGHGLRILTTPESRHPYLHDLPNGCAVSSRLS